MPTEIKSDKIFIRDVFNLWFRVPEYQRPYVWGQDEVSDLLEDITDAFVSRPDSQYFLGSIVLQTSEAKDGKGSVYQENDLLDGQQRLTTCLLLLAVARDLTSDPDLKATSQQSIFQKYSQFTGTPERLRIVYTTHPDVRDFVDKYVKPESGTNDTVGLETLIKSAEDISVRQMAKALLQIRSFFQASNAPNLEGFFAFFLTKVLLVYVASTTLDDAFRLFTVLNNRGLKLRSSDILKTHNLRALEAQGVSKDELKDKVSYTSNYGPPFWTLCL